MPVPALDAQTISPEEVEAVIRLLKASAAKSATGTPTSGGYAHGPGGIFSAYGQEPGVISTYVRPTGILESLPAYPTQFMHPLYPYLTGFRDDTGSDPATVCADCKVAGVKKACTQTAQFGRYCRETREFNVNQIGRIIDRSEPMDLRLLNPIAVGPGAPSIANQDPLTNEIAQAMVEVGISFERLLARQVWLGNPANNNVGGGYREFPGLDILIGTGKVDALTQTACPSLDSDLKDYNYQDVCAGTPGIVEVLTYMYRYCSKNARTMGLEPVDFRWAMREELFYELTSCWPCSYITYRCSNRDTAQIDPIGSFDVAEMSRMRDAMRNGRYLVVDGRQIPVVLDDGIAEDTNTNNAHLRAGEFASDIYLLPFSVRGNIASLYMEYFDYRPGYRALQSGPDPMVQDFFQTDAGKFSWTKSRINYCFLWLATIEPRMILRTPHLAGRLQNVKYSPLQHTREPFPTDGYFVDGGVTSRSQRTLYSEWGSVS